MKHRHSGPLVRYRSKKGRILHRKRPMHKLSIKKQSGRRGVRRDSFSDRERHLNNISQLQQEIEELNQELRDKEEGVQDLNKSAIKFDRNRFKDYTDEERDNLSVDEINQIFDSKDNPYDVDMKQLVEEESNIEKEIKRKLNAIREEKEFLDEI